MSKQELYEIRDGRAADRNFILATWLRGLRFGNDWFGLIDSGAYYEHYHRIIDSLLDSKLVVVKVACLKDDPDVVLGYAVLSADGTKIHWIFCKKAWRGIGIARALCPPTLKIATHATKCGADMIRKNKLTFNPFVI